MSGLKEQVANLCPFGGSWVQIPPSPQMEEELKYPVRINKYLAHQKICARREADELILQKKVRINGRVAVLGDKVKENDKVIVEGAGKKLVYLAFNKPKGIITHSPQLGEKEIKDVLMNDPKI